MFGRAMHGEPLPKSFVCLLAESLHQRLTGMRAHVVHNQMDGIGGGVVLGDL